MPPRRKRDKSADAETPERRNAPTAPRERRTAARRAPAQSPAGGDTAARWRLRALRRRPDGSCAEQPDFAPCGVGEFLPSVLAALGGDAARLRLVQLWRHWEMVLGPELAPLARPLGHHGESLLIGAEDAMLMQELHLQSGEILERVNAFMEGPFFSCVKVSLRFQRTELDSIGAPPVPPAPPAVRPHLTGEALRAMRPDSPVARCYARYVALARPGNAKDRNSP